MTDLISRQAVLEMLNDNELELQADDVFDGDLHRYKRAAQRIISQLPTIDEQKIAVEYCQKRNLVMITAESFEVLKAHYNRINGIVG